MLGADGALAGAARGGRGAGASGAILGMVADGGGIVEAGAGRGGSGDGSRPRRSVMRGAAARPSSRSGVRVRACAVSATGVPRAMVASAGGASGVGDGRVASMRSILAPDGAGARIVAVGPVGGRGSLARNGAAGFAAR